jgi:hypothetical protein
MGVIKATFRGERFTSNYRHIAPLKKELRHRDICWYNIYQAAKFATAILARFPNTMAGH